MVNCTLAEQPATRGFATSWRPPTSAVRVDLGSPMKDGFVAHHDGSTSDDVASVNGYSVIQAEGRTEALRMVRDDPLPALGSAYTIEIFEVSRR
jgi:hypothetical protein